jgi:hypothetical protein
MSKDRDPSIIEITNVTEIYNNTGSEIKCRGAAEWTRGEGHIEFGGHVSDGGRMVLEYQRI